MENNKSTILHDCCKLYGTDIKKILDAIECGTDVNGIDESGRTPLQIAAYNRNTAAVDILIKHGANPNIALKSAILSRNPEILAIIANSCSDLSRLRIDNQNILHYACSLVYPEAIEIILDLGFDPSMLNDTNDSPLHICCMSKRDHQMGDLKVLRYKEYNVPYDGDVWRDACELLLGKGANPIAKNSVGETPLHIAIKYGRFRVAALLLACGADLHISDYNSCTSYQIAVENNQSNSVDLLIELNGFPLHLVALGGGSGLLVPIINKSLKPTQRITSEGHTPLHYAIYHTYDVSPLLELIDAIDCINIPDKDGDTALHIAAQSGHAAQVKVLIDSGANPKIKNCSGYTPLDLVVHEMKSKKMHATIKDEYRLIRSLLR